MWNRLCTMFSLYFSMIFMMMWWRKEDEIKLFCFLDHTKYIFFVNKNVKVYCLPRSWSNLFQEYEERDLRGFKMILNSHIHVLSAIVNTYSYQQLFYYAPNFFIHWNEKIATFFVLFDFPCLSLQLFLFFQCVHHDTWY